MDWSYNTVIIHQIDINKVYQKDLKDNNINWPNQNFVGAQFFSIKDIII
ncbi:hypothetical protein M2372_002764 [Chryseobacterium sp. BIGb0232]|nr:hypothetical protein [Chryseobacterium sp. BIGb0232]ROS11412.1 hypothetical protein EDF65_3824 [Chryseobacterium nakagawai]